MRTVMVGVGRRESVATVVEWVEKRRVVVR